MLPCGSPASVCCMFVLLLRDNNNFTHRVHQATTVSTLDSHVLATLDGVALSAMSPSARSAAATDAAWHPMCAHATRAGKEAHAAHVRMRLAFLWIQSEHSTDYCSRGCANGGSCVGANTCRCTSSYTGTSSTSVVGCTTRLFLILIIE